MYFAERTYLGRHHNWQKQSAHKTFSFQTLVGSVSLQVLLLSGGSLAGIKKPEGKPIGYPANSIQDHQTESCSRSGAPARSFFQEYGNSIGYCWCNSSENNPSDRTLDAGAVPQKRGFVGQSFQEPASSTKSTPTKVFKKFGR